METYTVSQCICHNRSFREIKQLLKKNKFDSVTDLQKNGICACGCGLCIPYIERVIETGKTEFEPGKYY